MIKLYQFRYSPFVAKVRKCLELKGLAFEPVEVPYMDRSEMAALTRSVMVPALVDGDLAIVDSPRITAYLDERYAPSLRPGALAAAATVFESWSDQILEDTAFRISTPAAEKKIAEWNPGRPDAVAMYRFIKERKFGAGCIEAWAAGQDALCDKLSSLLEPLGRTLALEPFLLGDKPTLADAAVYGNFFMIEMVLPGRMKSIAPAMSEWYARVHAARG